MTVVLERAGAAFLRAFLAGIVTYGVGIWAAPNLNAGVALGAAAVAASIAGGIRAFQEFVPQFSFKSLLPASAVAYAALVDSFARAFIGYALTAATGWFLAPDLANWKAVAVGAVTGAFAAGFRALQGLTTSGESPKPESGR